MLQRSPYYVLCGFDSDGVVPRLWVLACCPNLRAAERVVNWQVRGAASRSDHRICTYDAARGMFLPITGGAVDFPLNPGERTREAYAAFMAAHGINPRDMGEA